eukprot:GHVH01004977.1.p1 GENE.GHVH01004977.1~~GHVH01004977.1.p1  ORF type:complete len:158 (-),score=15.28 GHVH01004977.1:812-1285(-)
MDALALSSLANSSTVPTKKRKMMPSTESDNSSDQEDRIAVLLHLVTLSPLVDPRLTNWTQFITARSKIHSRNVERFAREVETEYNVKLKVIPVSNPSPSIPAGENICGSIFIWEGLQRSIVCLRAGSFSACVGRPSICDLGFGGILVRCAMCQLFYN